MIARGEISEIKNDTGDRVGSGILFHMAAGARIRETFDGAFSSCKRCLVAARAAGCISKDRTFPCRSHKAAKIQGIVSVSHGGIDTEVARFYLQGLKMTTPFGNLIIVHVTYPP